MATEWQALQAQLTPISHYPEVLELDGEDLIKMMTKRIALVAKLERSATEAGTLRAQHDAITVDAADLTRGDEVDALAFAKSKVEAGQSDLPKREAQLLHDTADMRSKLATLGLAADGDLAQFILADPALATLENARVQLDDAHKHLQAAKGEAAIAGDRHVDATRALDETEQEAAVDPDIERLFLQVEAEDLIGRYSDALRILATARSVCTARGRSTMDGICARWRNRAGCKSRGPGGHRRAAKQADVRAPGGVGCEGGI